MIEKLEQSIKEHESEIIKLGNKADTSNDLLRKGMYTSQSHSNTNFVLF